MLPMMMVTKLVCFGPTVWIHERVNGFIWESVKHYFMVIITIFVDSGPMVGIQDQDGHVLSIMVTHALSSHWFKYIAFNVACVIVDYVGVSD